MHRVAGYSGTPLAKKLGIAPGARVALKRAPAGFRDVVAADAPEVRWAGSVRAPLDVAVAFCTRRAELTRDWPALARATSPAGAVWVAWPKRASGVPTDLTEDALRELLLPTGWVDTKVCAVDETWSGLRFVLRKELRGDRPTR